LLGFSSLFLACVNLPLPITTVSPITSLDLHHLCFISSDLKCYGSATSSFRNHLWSANEKEQWKNSKEKKSFPTHKMHFFPFFLLFCTPSTFKDYNFLFSRSFWTIQSVIGMSPLVLQIILEL
jgi:hypothetical protein